MTDKEYAVFDYTGFETTLEQIKVGDYLVISSILLLVCRVRQVKYLVISRRLYGKDIVWMWIISKKSWVIYYFISPFYVI